MSASVTLARIEAKRALRDPAVLLLIIIFALLAGYATHTGLRWAAARAETVAVAVGEADKTMVLRRAEFVKKVAAGERPAFGLIYATALPFRAGLPNAPLAPLSVGQAETWPAAAAISPFADPHAIFDRFSVGFESPAVLNAGRFDLAFVIVYLMPLLLLAGTHDFWTRERESGSARLQLAQPVRATSLIGMKVAVRGGMLLVPMVAIATLMLAVAGGPDPAGVTAFALVTLVYGLFWIALALAINLFARTSTRAALTCGTAWLTIVLLVPATAAAAVDLGFPAPSVTEYTNAVRAEGLAIRTESLAAAAAREARDAGKPEPPEGIYPHTLWAQRGEIIKRDSRLGPIHADFAYARERHRQIGTALRVASPAIAAQDSLDRIAGTDADRALVFQRQAQAFTVETRALAFAWMDAGRLMALADYDGGLPRFVFAEPGRSDALSLNLLTLALFCAGALGIAAAGFSRRAFLR